MLKHSVIILDVNVCDNNVFFSYEYQNRRPGERILLKRVGNPVPIPYIEHYCINYTNSRHCVFSFIRVY